MTAETIRCYRSNVRIYLNYLKGEQKDALTVDKKILLGFLKYLREERCVSHKRVENYFSSVSSFYEFLCYEDYVESNPVVGVRKRYLRRYKRLDGSGSSRSPGSVEDVSRMVMGTSNPRTRAIIVLLAKTGIRRGELVSIDVDDIDWTLQSVTLKPKAKRSNRLVFFDDEATRVLRRWMMIREQITLPGEKALFVGDNGRRINRNMVYNAVTSAAKKAGLHNPDSNKIEDHYSPHNLRHWFTTHLRKNNIRREFIQELRGDSRGATVDIYDHIDQQELREAYLAAIPKLGI